MGRILSELLGSLNFFTSIMNIVGIVLLLLHTIILQLGTRYVKVFIYFELRKSHGGGSQNIFYLCCMRHKVSRGESKIDKRWYFVRRRNRNFLLHVFSRDYNFDISGDLLTVDNGLLCFL